MSNRMKKKSNFHRQLILNQWVLGHFVEDSMHALRERIGDDRFEGIDVDGHSIFFHELTNRLFNSDRIEISDLTQYDFNVVSHWESITKRRNKENNFVLNMKYFQYLSLIFTEIYLDKYFNHSKILLQELNNQVSNFNESNKNTVFTNYQTEDLNKLAYWCATGSGKTLLMHVNLMQYLKYFKERNQNSVPDKIMLLTPNEGLSRQHLNEFQLSGLDARLFDKSSVEQLFKECIEIIEITKLSDETGEKTIATEAFEGNNLVLVDEGHRGIRTAGGAWMQRRSSLVSGGFSFEYSATFSQSVAKGNTVNESKTAILKEKSNKKFEKLYSKLTESQKSQIELDADEINLAKMHGIRESYAKSILVDYSYKYFHADGYGKNSLILNLSDKYYKDYDQFYFMACLLSFYQQILLFEEHQNEISEFNIEKPLWIFVGNTVSKMDADLLIVLKMFSKFLREPDVSIDWISKLQRNDSPLLDSNGDNIFRGRFKFLEDFNANYIYKDILKLVFNADVRQNLNVINLVGSEGELALKVGDSENFGVINVGDNSKLFRNVSEIDGIDTSESPFEEGLFESINNKDSKLNILIGSRKFSEGWSSWRVSTMGLLNLGQSEGAQIIQLFGRGVRLKGREMSLKRSTPNERRNCAYIEKLETLNVFGIRASYMEKFKEFMREEGMVPSDELVQINFETIPNLPKKSELELKSLKLKDGYAENQEYGFKHNFFVDLFEIPNEFKGKINFPQVALDMYPRVDIIKEKSNNATEEAIIKKEVKFESEVFEFLDWDKIYLAIQDHKIKSKFNNLNINLENIKEFCINDNDWYTLFAPSEKFNLDCFDSIFEQEKLLISLLKDLTTKFYNRIKNVYESRHYDIELVSEDSPSMLKFYELDLDESNEDSKKYLERIEELKKIVNSEKFRENGKTREGDMVAIYFSQHLYYPLMHFIKSDNLPLKMSPMSFDSDSELNFVYDLMEYYKTDRYKDVLSEKSIYLLRNADNRHKGIGFAMAGNFYPDFLLWIVDNKSDKQWLNFVDPKGIRFLSIDTDPKFGLYKEIKNVETELGDKNLKLNAFIISQTKYSDLIDISKTKEELENRHIIFMEDGKIEYLRKMFERILNS